jgi:transcriptional regulator with XRE-family HTH domain
MQNNAIKQARKRLGLSRKKMAVLAGVSYNALANVELGYPRGVNLKILQAFERLGVDADKLAADYEKQRQALATEIAGEKAGGAG